MPKTESTLTTAKRRRNGTARDLINDLRGMRARRLRELRAAMREVAELRRDLAELDRAIEALRSA